MANEDYVTDIAVTLDSFFKGLSDCGLLTTYTVELQSRVIDIALKQKFSHVVNEFMANLRMLLIKFSKSSSEPTECEPPREDIYPLLELLSQELDNNEVQVINEQNNFTLIDNLNDKSLIEEPYFEHSSGNDINGLLSAEIEHENSNTNMNLNNCLIDPLPVEFQVNSLNSSLDSHTSKASATAKCKKRSKSECTSESTEVTEVITKYKQKQGWQCDMCCETFKTMSRLEEHCRDEHAGRGCFECNFCGFRLMTKSTLTRHIKLHLAKNEGVCSICNRKFSRLDYLSLHYKNHVGQTLYNCKTCRKRYYSKAQFDIHEKSHSNPLVYICHKCNKSFKRKDKLKDHMMRHLKIKRFVCNFCDKSYVEKRDLRSHLKLHEEAELELEMI